MKYIIPRRLLPDLKAKLNSGMQNIYNEKYYHKSKRGVNKYISLCNAFYLEKKSVNKLIKRYFRGSKTTFYIGAKKILQGYRNENFWELRFKSTRPKNITYLFSAEIKKQICDYYFEYKMVAAGGVLSLYHNIHQGNVHEIESSKVPKSVNTFYRGIRKDKRYKEIKDQIKRTKRHFKRYEVSDIGLLQMDAKIFTSNNFPITQNKLYVYDFIDEKSRIALGYVYEYLGVETAKNAVSRAIEDFKSFGIKVKRIRTDNGAEFTTAYRKRATYINPINPRSFYNFLGRRNIMHELTPIRSPQSNGKIERFHRNYNNLFGFKKKIKVKLDCKQLQVYLNKWYVFYNFKRRHKSLNFKTPVEALNLFKTAK